MPEVRVLSLSTNYPRAHEKKRGLFVRSRLQHLGRILPVKVVSPVALVDYARQGQPAAYPDPRLRDEELEVFHPRWFYPPYGGMTNGWFLAARLIPFLRRLRREYAFDVIDAHFGHPEGIAAALAGAALRVPFTVTLRGSETMHAAQAAGRKRWIGWALRRAARVIAVAESLRKFAISLGAHPDRARTIPNGVDAEMFFPRPYGETRARLGMPANRRVILTAGHLIELKGHHRAVRALAALRQDGIDAELWIAGGAGRAASYEAQIREEVRRHGLGDLVRFVGALPQNVLAEHMSAADVFCLASSREGWPNVAHEALACGAPVVATAVGGIEDMIPRPEHGTVVPVGDEQALTAALATALRREWDREAISAWGRARSWTQVARETAEILRAAAERRSVDSGR